MMAELETAAEMIKVLAAHGHQPLLGRGSEPSSGGRLRTRVKMRSERWLSPRRRRLRRRISASTQLLGKDRSQAAGGRGLMSSPTAMPGGWPAWAGGTALGVVRSAVAAGKSIHVYACETRPLHQGSRLTAWELAQDGIPVTLICDSMSGSLMRKGRIDKVIVGADRITRDAVFNKIGTYSHAVLARHHRHSLLRGSAALHLRSHAMRKQDIIVEERDPEEICTLERACGWRPRASRSTIRPLMPRPWSW
ncbi:MAG: hypothetical protein MZV70_36400 [Desulfobacterales bacterium]|nr:hypothetical protein [Desulfobacterales bacterium]